MPRSTFRRTVTVLSPPEETWSALLDVPRLVGWVSILQEAHEIEPLSRYSAVLMDRLGPFKLRADLDITLSDVEPGRSLRARAAGEDRSVGSRLSVEAQLLLAERPDGPGSLIAVEGVYEVTGKVASMGSGTINKKAQKIMDEFFESAKTSLGAP